MKKTLVLSAAALTALLAFPGRAAAQSDDGGDVQIAILDVLLERGLIDQAQYDELLAMARAKVASEAKDIDLIEGRLARLTAPDVQVEGGKPGKLEFKSADGKWSMGLNGYIQARYADRNSDADGRDGSNFSVPRARLAVQGNSGAKNIKYKLEVDMSTNPSQDADLDGTEPSEQRDARLKDAYIDYGVTENGAIRFGQYKFPFGREELISDSNGQFNEKSIADKAYTPAREPGASWQGKLGDGAFEYQLAASNGEGEGEPNMVDSNVLGTGDGMRYGGRVVWYPMGEMKYDTPSFQTLDGSTKMAIGAAYMLNHDASFLNVVSAALPGAGTDTGTLGGEFQLMSGPFSLLAEYYDRTTDPDGAPNQDDHGYNLQAGYFVVPAEWEVAARLSEVDLTDDPILGAAAVKTQEKSLGINRYLDAQNAKWSLNYVDLDNDTVSDQDESQIQLQFQVKF